MAKLTFNKLKRTEAIWLPQVPEHWELVKVRHLFYESTKKGFPNETLLVASQEHGVVSKEAYGKRTVEASKDLQNLKLVEQGDFIISLRSFQGGIELAHERGIISPAYTIMKETRQIEKRYFKNLFKSPPFISLMTLCVKGIREGQNIDYPTFKNEYLPFPPVEEQRAISAYLDKKNAEIDKFIRNKERLIELLEEEKMWEIKEKVTKGLNSATILKESKEYWIGKIPKHWDVKKLKRCCQVKRGASPRPIDDPAYFSVNGEYGWVRILDVTASNKYLEFTEQKLSKKGISHSIKMEYGDIFLSIAGSVGKPMISKIKCCIHDGFVWFKNLVELDNEFLYYVFLSGKCFEGLGKIGTQLNLNTDTVGMISIPIPPLNEQKEIVIEIIKEEIKINLIISKAQQEISSIKEYREALITDLVTGKRSVAQ